MDEVRPDQTRHAASFNSCEGWGTAPADPLGATLLSGVNRHARMGVGHAITVALGRWRGAVAQGPNARRRMDKTTDKAMANKKIS